MILFSFSEWTMVRERIFTHNKDQELRAVEIQSGCPDLGENQDAIIEFFEVREQFLSLGLRRISRHDGVFPPHYFESLCKICDDDDV